MKTKVRSHDKETANKSVTRDICKTLWPLKCPKKVFLVTDVLYNWISQFKISCTHVWIRNSWFSKLLVKRFWQIWPGDLDLSPSDPKIDRVPLLPRTDVWTMFEEGRSWSSREIDRKQFWHLWPWWPWHLT